MTIAGDKNELIARKRHRYGDNTSFMVPDLRPLRLRQRINDIYATLSGRGKEPIAVSEYGRALIVLINATGKAISCSVRPVSTSTKATSRRTIRVQTTAIPQGPGMGGA